MPPFLLPFLAASSCGFLLFLFLASQVVFRDLSPQGCRMSWMSPAYILQNKFDASWTPLARRYTLWLYREDGWEFNQLHGAPVLFIPGNAGSSRQVRSIASSATRQFFSSPGVVSDEFKTQRLESLDFFTVEFNEDLSAFHGTTLESQTAYTSRAIDYIASLYPPNTSIIILGHSMGGIVATSLLPSDNISAIITMSTPHLLPPARFDSRIDSIYRRNVRALMSDPTPILSLCGGATDAMIPSESCVLENKRGQNVYRRTVFTSALEGAWTGVGHREMVWCHQVRWRIARAALELGLASSPGGRGAVLDRWLRDGHMLPAPETLNLAGGGTPLENDSTYESLPEGQHLVVKKPTESQLYLLPVPQDAGRTSAKFVLFVSQGAVLSVLPQHPIPLKASVYTCSVPSQAASHMLPRCVPLKPTTLKLIPNPVSGTMFPVPGEGSDESEGVVLYEAEVSVSELDGARWVGVKLEHGDGRGWVVGGISKGEEVVSTTSTFSLLFWSHAVHLPHPDALRTRVRLPRLLFNALMVYRVKPIGLGRLSGTSCSGPLLAPLIMHTSQPFETHYFPVHQGDRRILLHTHHPAPYILPLETASQGGLEFVIYSSGQAGCKGGLLGVQLDIDWMTTFGRIATRYPTTLITWSVGIVALIIFQAWTRNDHGNAVPTVQESLSVYARYTLPKLLLASLLCAFVPLPETYYLGTSGAAFFAFIAPAMLLIASGLVCLSWWIMLAMLWPVSKIFPRVRRPQQRSLRRSAMLSMAVLFLLIFLLVPWQVAYLGCWLIHFYTCATLEPPTDPQKQRAASPVAIPLIRIQDENGEPDKTDELEDSARSPIVQEHALQIVRWRSDNYNHNMHLLLLMTWLLPLVAPVLVVWVRTLVTAGLTSPFDGDHLFLNVAPFLLFVDFAFANPEILVRRQSFEDILPVRWSLVALAATAFFVGPRQAYSVFDAAKITIGIIVLVRIGRRYWGGPSWS